MSIGTTYANDTSVTTRIQALDCCNCGLTFGISDTFEAERRKDKRTFYCPNGHPQGFYGKNTIEQELDAARALAERESRRRRWAEESAQRSRETADTERRRAAAYKGHATRIRNRIKNGVCPVPGCKRHFTNVRRHIATQHPDFQIPEATA